MDKLITTGRKVLKGLHDAGFEAFFVGGFVRDHLLKIQSTDIDITTSAKPDQVKPLFDTVILTGEKYGTVTVIIDKVAIEVTTYRTEMGYIDFRHPDHVSFVGNLKDDLSRRDFTINQLTMDIDGTIIDHFQGLDDLNNRLIKTINNPHDRFKEDALRMLRAFRFAAKLGFDIEEKTLQAIHEEKDLIKHIPIERIQDELMKIFNLPYKHHAVSLMIKSSFHEALSDLKNGLEKLSQVSEDYDSLLAMSFLYYEGSNLEEILKLAHKKIQFIKTITQIHHKTKTTPYNKEILFEEGIDNCLLANKLSMMYKFKDRQDEIKALYEDLPIKKEQELKYRGKQITKDLKLSDKKHIGLIIKALTKSVINRELKNTEPILKKAAEEIAEKLNKEAITDEIITPRNQSL